MLACLFPFPSLACLPVSNPLSVVLSSQWREEYSKFDNYFEIEVCVNVCVRGVFVVTLETWKLGSGRVALIKSCMEMRFFVQRKYEYMKVDDGVCLEIPDGMDGRGFRPLPRDERLLVAADGSLGEECLFVRDSNTSGVPKSSSELS